jgi:hypothetical protein
MADDLAETSHIRGHIDLGDELDEGKASTADMPESSWLLPAHAATRKV